MSTKTKEEEEFEILRKHILSCSNISKDSKAVLAALEGLNTELKRMERDSKLKRKFISNKTTTTETVTMENEQLSNNTTTKISSSSNNKTAIDDNHDETMMDEWQDVATSGTGSLGNHLAQLAVTTIAKHQTEVKTPLGAIALALHASLLTDSLGFACTGIPEPQAAPKGFAPPIRELPKTQLVPAKWEDVANRIVLRYRKQGVGTVVLSVTKEGEETKVSLSRGISSNESSEPLVFSLQDHANLESFQKALRKSSSVLPALHYKALPVLLTNFCNKFDLGSIREEDSACVPPERLPYYDSTVIPPSVPQDPLRITSSRPPARTMEVNPYDTPTIQVFQPYPNRGDFAGDLMPPGHGGYMGDNPGSLMGPNHPLFAGRGPGGMPMPGNGGFGMQPRFDPYGPPGGPQDPNNVQPPGGRRRPPPGGFGNPNNDHARPPSDLGNNMFM